MTITLPVGVETANAIRYVVVAVVISILWEMELRNWGERLLKRTLLAKGFIRLGSSNINKRRGGYRSKFELAGTLTLIGTLLLMASEMALEFSSGATVVNNFSVERRQVHLLHKRLNTTANARPFYYEVLRAQSDEAKGTCFNEREGEFVPTYLSNAKPGNTNLDSIIIWCPNNHTLGAVQLNFSEDFILETGQLAPLDEDSQRSLIRAEDAMHGSLRPGVFRGTGRPSDQSDQYLQNITFQSHLDAPLVRRREPINGLPIGRVKFINTPSRIYNLSSTVQESAEDSGVNYIALQYIHEQRRIDCLLKDEWDFRNFEVQGCSFMDIDRGLFLARAVELVSDTVDIDLTARLESVRHILTAEMSYEDMLRESFQQGTDPDALAIVLPLTTGTRFQGHIQYGRSVATRVAAGVLLAREDSEDVAAEVLMGSNTRATISIWGVVILVVLFVGAILGRVVRCLWVPGYSKKFGDLNTAVGVATLWKTERVQSMDGSEVHGEEPVYLVLTKGSAPQLTVAGERPNAAILETQSKET